MSGTTLGVVVATRDRPRLLDECLASLSAATGPDDELIVVDSCSNDATTAELARERGARLLRCEVPGASLARNVGWRASTAPVVAFVDDDVRVHAGWAQGIRRALHADPDAAFVTGRLGLRPQDSAAERPVALFDHATPFAIDRTVVDHLGHGANLAVKRSALEAVGGYDERLGPGARWHAAEDLDLLDRLLASGRTGRYEPSMAAFHVQWRSRRDLLRLEWRYGIGQGARLTRLRRADPSRFREIARITWREQGLEALSRCVREHYEFGALSALVRLSGTAVGRSSAEFSAARAAGAGPAKGRRARAGIPEAR